MPEAALPPFNSSNSSAAAETTHEKLLSAAFKTKSSEYKTEALKAFLLTVFYFIHAPKPRLFFAASPSLGRKYADRTDADTQSVTGAKLWDV